MPTLYRISPSCEGNYNPNNTKPYFLGAFLSLPEPGNSDICCFFLMTFDVFNQFLRWKAPLNQQWQITIWTMIDWQFFVNTEKSIHNLTTCSLLPEKKTTRPGPNVLSHQIPKSPFCSSWFLTNCLTKKTSQSWTPPSFFFGIPPTSSSHEARLFLFGWRSPNTVLTGLHIHQPSPPKKKRSQWQNCQVDWSFVHDFLLDFLSFFWGVENKLIQQMGVIHMGGSDCLRPRFFQGDEKHRSTL